ncbi:RecQ family ATP-dependent DNA helicase [Myxococcota bacterium]|nr:RecQ family ATP-dependent DNA helicase [Myxococcota bacterium]
MAARRLGIDRLRDEQIQVIEDIVSGRDVLMVIPTGSGKSACYQVPSMVLPKPVVVISPLRALLQDQSTKLEKLGVPCIRLDGTLRGKARANALTRIRRGGSLLVMTTPETMENAEVRENLSKAGVSLIAIDEAHCLSEWGHDFRPAYLRLGARVRELGSPSVLALTATATPRVREAIVNSLRMDDPRVVATSPHRSNLAFEVLRCEADARARALVRLVLRLRRPGIVYCATRREVDFVFALLQRFQVPARRYHGAMTATERNASQDHFMRRGQRSVMVATNAFGLGIDKPDIRYVLHYQSPASLEQYVQEAGRGGRDGKKANCILLYDAADREIHEALLARSRVRPDQLYKIGSALAAWAGEQRMPTLEALALSAELGPRISSALLAKIEEAGLVEILDDGIQINEPTEAIEEDTRSLAGQFETLRTQDGRRLDALNDYSGTDQCRATFLQSYFGEDNSEPCGLCDVCIGGRTRPPTFFAPLEVPKPKAKSKSKGRGRSNSRDKNQKRQGRRRQNRRRRGRPSASSERRDGGGDPPPTND